MSFTPYSIQEAKTPSYALDRSVFRANCREMVERASKLKVDLRVHVKTHKTIEGARIQLEGIPEEKQAIIVSTLAELKYFADHGFQDITLGIPFGTHQLPELAEYSKRIRSLNLFVDMEEHVSLLENTDGVYHLFIKIDTGYHRAGLDASVPEPIVSLAKRIVRSRNCSLLGLYSHAGHSYDQPSIEEVKRVAREERDAMVRVRRILESEGIAVPVVSCGSTPACSLSDEWAGVTEIHAGNYCCFDRMQVAIGSCDSLSRNAGRLLMRVLSVYPDRNTILADGGGIPLSKDKGGLENWGVVKDHPELYVAKLSQEHAILTSDEPIDFSEYPIGTVLVVYPNHSCMTAAQHEKYLILEGDQVVDTWVPAKFCVGVGFDTKGAGKLDILGPDTTQPPEEYIIEDSREGWVRSVGVLLQSYFGDNGAKTPVINFDYSHIRKQGEELKTYGGKSSGPEPLIELHKKLREVLDQQIGTKISSTTITDIFNLIGRCVIGIGNIRAAEIAFGEVGDDAFLDLKDYEKNPHRADYGWTSNNSVFAEIGMDYSKIAEHVAKSGEPGLAWLENMRHYGRMCDPRNDKDIKVKGGNPCLEQSLESYELCCLVETFPARHASLEEFKRTLKFAYLYAKTVTLGRTHWAQTNRVMLRNRRIGCSVSGIAQFLAKHNLEELRQWLDEGYQTVQHWDEVYSEWLCVPKSIKTTSVKPSGTVSLLAGATPGMHYPLGKYYIRRVRFQADSDMLPALRQAGYHIEPCIGQEKTMVVVSFPACAGENITVQEDVSIFEQFSLAAFLQKYWADNQVSCTISFNPETESDKITKCLDFFQYQLKGVAMLPRVKLDMFPQMPYEKIDEATYNEMVKDLKPINWDSVEEIPPVIEETAEEITCNPRECNFCDTEQTDLNLTGQYKAD